MYHPTTAARRLVILAACLGAMTATVAAAEFRPVEGHQAVQPGEHPRLIVRQGEQHEGLQADAATPWGQRVVQRTHQALRLMDTLAITGRNREVIKEAGFKAAGLGAMHLLTGNRASAAEAGEIVLRQVIAYPMASSLDVVDRASRLHGTAIAYDLCHDAWPADTRRQVREWLLRESAALRERVGPANRPGGDAATHVIVWAAGGMADLAVLGDAEDDGARQRLAQAEQAVLGYLAAQLDESGFGAEGESPRQAAMASGVVPFVLANRNVTGRDLTWHPAIRSVLVPMVYQTIPGVGMPMTGGLTAAIDRTGLFAMATPLTPEEKRPGVAWLFQQVGGDRYLGIVRPHQGLYMLSSGMGEIEPVMPQDWPRVVPTERFTVARSRWQDQQDVVTVLWGQSLRLAGLGRLWIDAAGPHVGIWSHDAGTGRIDNAFQNNLTIDRNAFYRVRSTSRLAGSQVDAEGLLASLTVRVEGQAERTRSTHTVREQVDGRRVERQIAIPEGGPFQNVRTVGVDYTERSGAAALLVIADEFTGPPEAQRTWVLHFGPAVRVEADGRTFTVRGEGEATLTGTVIYPADASLRASSNPPHTNFLSFNTGSDRVQVVLTLQEGAAPQVRHGEGGLGDGVRVGDRALSLEDGRVIFGE